MSTFEFMHFRKGPNSTSGATVAILPADGTAIISIAFTGPEDMFVKKVGRDISSGRIMAYITGRNDGARVQEINVTDRNLLKATVADAIQVEMNRKGYKYSKYTT